MEDRPAIPSELRRQILVEAGHRCAIPTCKHPEVDIHHIVPWETCREHEYGNLVALCPNCHRRAGSGEIDRKSLRIYKTRLSSSVTSTESIALTPTARDEDSVPNSGWKILKLTEKKIPPNPLNFDLEVPSFFDADLDELNVLEHAWALSRLHDLRSFRLHNLESDLASWWANGVVDYCTGSFEVLHFSQNAVSIKYALDTYGVGAAHGNFEARTTTVQRGPLIPLRTFDLFRLSSGYLSVISAYCTKCLLASRINTSDRAAAWIREGASPEDKNFDDFNLTREGVLFIFGKYQVACGVDGPQYVTIPWSELDPILNRRCHALEGLAW